MAENNPIDTTGLPIHYSGEWEPIDVSVENYRPGRSFRLLVGTPGNLLAKGLKMKRKNVFAIPVQEGYNPILCDEIITGAANTADNLVALF